MPGVITQFPTDFGISSINGINGFTITDFPQSGSPINTQGGYSVSGIGDINDDGIKDLAIGAPLAFDSAGACYIVFGNNGLGGSGILSVANLNGANGFLINDFPANYLGGWSVSGAGDINHDGIADLIVSGIFGYVVFGKVGIGASGILSISSLDGTNGFSLINDNSYSVSSAGDVNLDGIEDLIIGNKFASSGAGAGYVIFGHTGIGSSGNFDLTSLNGANGFIITGFPASSAGGYCVSGGGDINKDGIADLIIGASNTYVDPSTNTVYGTIYVIFGASGIGSSGTINISNLNGNNGFSIPDFWSGDGLSASNKGDDINGDGIADLLVGEPATSTSFVAFGKSGIGTLGLSAETLLPPNGLPIEPAYPPELLGSSISGIGDFNADGIADLIIGAPYNTNSHYTRSYVVFGNTGIANQWPFYLLRLNGQNGFSIIGADLDANGHSVSGIGDINGDGIVDLISGAPYWQSGGTNQGASYVIFGDKVTSLLVSNQLIIQEGQTLVLNSNYFNVTNPLDSEKNPTLLFTITNTQHGYFSTVGSSSSLTSFLQSQIQSGQIQFIHDGSQWAPSFNFTVGYRIAQTSVQFASIKFLQDFIIDHNNLTINQGQTVILTTSNLSASDLDNAANNPNLIFVISGIQHGYFALVSAPTTPITRFTQAQVENGNIQFVHDNSLYPTSYNVGVINGAASIAPQASAISFDLTPILVNNNLTINQGKTVIITSSFLSATDSDASTASLVFIISNVQHGYFSFVSSPTTAITSFTQAQVQSVSVQFIQDGTSNSPSYSVAVSDGRATSIPQSSTITFILDPAPIITINQLSVEQGMTIILTENNINAEDSNGNSLTFTVSNVQHGYFSLVSNPGIAITSFTQAQIQAGEIEFVPDGGSTPPSYNIAVSDGYSSSSTSVGAVTFTPTTAVSNSNSNTTRNAIIGGTVSGGLSLLFLILKLYITQRAAKNLQKTLDGGATEIEKEQITYYKDVVRPIANKIFEQINTAGFLGYRSEKDAKLYVAAIEDIISKLARLGVTINLKAMSQTERSLLLNQIAREVKKKVGKNYSYFSTDYLISFFKPEVTPQELEKKSESIAQAIYVARGGSSPVKNTIPDSVIHDFAEKIFEQLRISGICNSCCIKKSEYVEGVRLIVEELRTQKINVDWSTLEKNEKEIILNETAKQTGRILKPLNGCCTSFLSTIRLTGEIKPQQLIDHADNIAISVKEVLPTTLSIKQESGDKKSFAVETGGSEIEMTEKSVFFHL